MRLLTSTALSSLLLAAADSVHAGENLDSFNTAPPHTQMNLCNIHFHKNADLLSPMH